MKSAKPFYILLLVSSLLLIQGCDAFNSLFGIQEEDNPSPESFFDEHVIELADDFTSLETPDGDTLGQHLYTSHAVVDRTDSDPSHIASYTVTNYKVGERYDELTVLNPQTSVIYPGSVLIGSSIPTGAYTQIVGGTRRPITISTSLVITPSNEGDSTVSATIENPDSLAQVREGINGLITQEGVVGSMVTSMEFEKREVHSHEELQLAVGANYSYDGPASISVAGNFQYDSLDQNTEILVKMMQVYYTIDVDAMAPDSFYITDPNLENLGAISPVYVASVAYGRLAYLSIKTGHSVEEINAALNASFSYANHSGDISSDVTNRTILDNSQINATIIGSSDTTAIGGFEDFIDFLRNRSSFSIEEPGSPVSYTLKYVKDNSIAAVLLSSEYSVRVANFIAGYDPTALTGQYSITIDRMGFSSDDDAGSHGEVYGQISATGYTNNRTVNLGGLNLMNTGENNTVDILQDVDLATFGAYGGTAVNYTAVLDFVNGTQGNNSIYIGFRLSEEDTGSDEVLGWDGHWVDLTTVGTTSYSNFITLTGGNNQLNCHYIITRL